MCERPILRFLRSCLTATILWPFATAIHAADKDIVLGPLALPLPPEAAEIAAVIESTCGPHDDSQHVELYVKVGTKPEKEFVAKAEPSAVLLQWRDDLADEFQNPGDDPGRVAGKFWCSGTLIEPNLVLTAAHCLQPITVGLRTPRRGPNGIPLGPNELAKLMVIKFRHQVNGEISNADPANPAHIRKSAEFKVSNLLEDGFTTKRKNLDYAILEIAKDSSGRLPGQVFPKAKYDASDNALADTTNLTIVQHPINLLQAIASGLKKVDSGPITDSTDKDIFYNNLDTLSRSSGAGILNQERVLVGVHTNGGCTAMGQGSNRGTALKAIRRVSDVIN